MITKDDMGRIIKDHRFLSRLAAIVFLSVTIVFNAFAGDENKPLPTNAVSGSVTKMDAEEARLIAQKWVREYERAKWLFNKGEYQSCLKSLAQIPSEVKDQTLKLKCELMKSQALLKLEKFQDALEVATGLASDNLEACYLKAKALIGLKRVDEAEIALNKVIAKRNDLQGYAYFTLALLKKDQGEPETFESMMSDAALKKYLLAARLTALGELMWYYLEKDELTPLNETYSRFSQEAMGRTDWGVSMTRRHLASALEENGLDDSLALRILTDLAESNFQKPCSPLWNAEAYLRCGDIYLRNNQLVKAKDEYQKCLYHAGGDERIGSQAKKMLEALE